MLTAGREMRVLVGVTRFFYLSYIQSTCKAKKCVFVFLALQRNRESKVLCSYHSIAGVRSPAVARAESVAAKDFPAHCFRLTADCHLITFSARMSTIGGIVRPICFAVLRLITNSNFVGCSTGKSAGLAPLRILST